ncbi:hypothetical protein KFE96_06575 [Kordiimonas sp. SCSIO 12603]|uniref:hypothetical protein n=1 Tax=Kordiimonas sp. SCSIO 12603 TaxID=2829596 RepID=UPI002106D772|nr:hypothetical protein [Kordiimonas sp. SCSIO 12603]UTW59965.1 hypothetical protein KFE96_06575 [Kordiimonas sp. SCSIO 12603]
MYSRNSPTYEAAAKIASYGTLLLGEDVLPLSPAARKLYELYQSAAVDGLADRKKISLPTLGRMAAQVTIFEPVPLNPDDLENEAEDDARIRLLGSATAQFYGEITGTLISEYKNATIAGRILKAIRLCQMERNILAAATKIDGAETPLELRAIYFPMTTDGKNANQIFCHLAISEMVEDSIQL